MTVRELRDHLSSEPDDTIVYVDPNPTSPGVWDVVGVDSYDQGPTGTWAVVLLTNERT